MKNSLFESTICAPEYYILYIVVLGPKYYLFRSEYSELGATN